MKSYRMIILLLLSISILPSFVVAKPDRFQYSYEAPWEMAKSNRLYDSVIGKMVFIERSISSYYDGKYYKLQRYEFDTTLIGQLLYRVIDSCQMINCFTSLELTYSNKYHYFRVSNWGNGAMEAKGLIYCKDSKKPLYLSKNLSDSLLELSHIRKCTDSLDVKYIHSMMELDRNGFNVLYKIWDLENVGLQVLYEDYPVDSCPRKDVRDHWQWLRQYRKND